MKKSALTLFLIIIFSGIKAQEEITFDRFILGGSMNFVTQTNAFPLSTLPINSGIGILFSDNSDNTKNTIFSISPYLGKEINSNWLIGIELKYRYDSFFQEDVFSFNQPDPTDLTIKSNDFGFGLFGRYTLNPAQRFHLFLQPFAQYNFLVENTKNDNELIQVEKASYIEAGVGLGILYAISTRFRFTLRTGGLNYINGNWKIKDTDIRRDFSSFGFNLNLSTIFIGVEMKL